MSLLRIEEGEGVVAAVQDDDGINLTGRINGDRCWSKTQVLGTRDFICREVDGREGSISAVYDKGLFIPPLNGDAARIIPRGNRRYFFCGDGYAEDKIIGPIGDERLGCRAKKIEAPRRTEAGQCCGRQLGEEGKSRIDEMGGQKETSVAGLTHEGRKIRLAGGGNIDPMRATLTALIVVDGGSINGQQVVDEIVVRKCGVDRKSTRL